MWKRRTALAAMGAAALTRLATAHEVHRMAGHQEHEMDGEGPTRLVAEYRMPHSALLDESARPFDPATELARPGPVLLDFIYTTCPGICPMLSAVLGATADALGSDLQRTRLWSVTIDPDYDTPKVLQEYAAALSAPPEWRFLTGPKGEIDRVRDAFGALDDNKMAHRALVLLGRGDGQWVRFEGTFGHEALAAEVRAALASA